MQLQAKEGLGAQYKVTAENVILCLPPRPEGKELEDDVKFSDLGLATESKLVGYLRTPIRLQCYMMSNNQHCVNLRVAQSVRDSVVYAQRSPVLHVWWQDTIGRVKELIRAEFEGCKLDGLAVYSYSNGGGFYGMAPSNGSAKKSSGFLGSILDNHASPYMVCCALRLFAPVAADDTYILMICPVHRIRQGSSTRTCATTLASTACAAAI